MSMKALRSRWQAGAVRPRRRLLHGGLAPARCAAIRTLVLLGFAVVPTSGAIGHGHMRAQIAGSALTSDGLTTAASSSSLRFGRIRPQARRIQIAAMQSTATSGQASSGAGTYYDWDDFDETSGMYDLTANYYAHMASPDMHVSPTNPWDLGINPYVPDRLENWFYGRTPDGTGGAWSNEGGIWTYWSRTGDLLATYRATYAGDPAVVKTVTFSTSTTQSIDFGFYKYVNESANTTTVYLRSGQ